MPDSPLTDVTIQSLGGLGDGIAELNGKPLFVSKSCVGDRLSIRITQQTAQHSRGEIVEILSPGPDRTNPPCQHFTECGGCVLQHLKPDAYRSMKTAVVQNAIHQSGYDTTQDALLFIPEGHRRRVEFRIGRKNGKLQPAYYMPGTRTLLPIDSCLLLCPSLAAFLPQLMEALESWPHTGDIQSFKLTALGSGIELTLCTAGHIAKAVLVEFAKLLDITRLTLDHDRPEIVWEKSPLTIKLGAYDIKLPPDSFLQATDEAQARLTSVVLEYAKDAAHVADLFCGIGTYGFALAERTHVHGVELHRGMVESLRQSVKEHNPPKRFTVECRDLFKNPLKTKELAPFDAVVINPPRPGAKAQAESIAASSVPLVIMISCSPASWARDARILRQSGYTLAYVQGIDQFVYSPHLEIASVFTR